MNLDTVLDFWNALQQQQWPAVVGFVIVFLIYGANRFGLQAAVGSKWIPVISVTLGILSAIGAQLILGISWMEAIIKGFFAGASATGLWELGLKRVLPAVPAAKAVTTPVVAETPTTPVVAETPTTEVPPDSKV